MPKYLVLEWPFDGEEDESELNFTEGSLSIVRDMAHDRCASEHRVIVIAEYIDTVRPGAPVWDSAAPAQPAEAERYAVGELVLADWDRRYDEESLAVQDWRDARILPSRDSRLGYWRVEFLCDPGEEYEMRSDEIKRRPAPAQPKPLAFTFGQQVRCGIAKDGTDCKQAIGLVVDNIGVWRVVVVEDVVSLRGFDASELTPI